MGRKPLPANPNPFNETDLPAPVLDVVKKFTKTRAELVHLSSDKPREKKHPVFKSRTINDEDYRQRMQDWTARRDQAAAWLSAHADSPIVKQAVSAVKRSDKYRERKVLGRRR